MLFIVMVSCHVDTDDDVLWKDIRKFAIDSDLTVPNAIIELCRRGLKNGRF